MKQFLPGATTAQRSLNALLVYLAFYALLAGALYLGGLAVDTGSSVVGPAPAPASRP